MSKVQDKFIAIRNQLNNAFLEREELSTVMVASVLGKFNTFILGDPGVAKSQMVRYLAEMFTDATVFDRQCHPTQVLSDIIGPLKTSELQKGNDVYERKLVRYLAKANIAFLDEVGRSGGQVRDAILGIMNERQYWNGDKLVQCPLECMFSGSNHLLTDNRDSAFMDRYLYCYVAPSQIKEESNFRKLIRRWSSPKPTTLVTLKELHSAQKTILEMGANFPKETEDALCAIQSGLLLEGIQATPRTWRNISTALSAFAYLDGDDALRPKHLEWMADALWKTPKERNAIISAVGKVSNPLLSEAVRKLDRLKAEYDQLPTDHNASNWIESVSSVNGYATNVVADLTEFVERTDTPRLRSILEEAKSIKKELKRRCDVALGVAAHV